MKEREGSELLHPTTALINSVFSVLRCLEDRAKLKMEEGNQPRNTLE
jgi:hypothetical protein